MNVKLIDCHSHLLEPHFTREAIQQCLRRAASQGALLLDPAVGIESYPIESVVIVTEHSADTAELMRSIEEASSDNNQRNSIKLLGGVGLHPEHVSRWTEDQLDVELKAMESTLQSLDTQSIVCIGECGLDRQPRLLNPSNDQQTAAEEIWERQLRAFQQQLHWSHTHHLPVNVHSRQAGHYAIEELKRHRVDRALLHAFDGQFKYARQAVEAGYYLSVPPSVCRSPSTAAMHRWIRDLPLDHLVLESDAPALGPHAQSREPNEPFNINYSCWKIAQIRGISMEEVARATSDNARRLFPGSSQACQ